MGRADSWRYLVERDVVTVGWDMNNDPFSDALDVFVVSLDTHGS